MFTHKFLSFTNYCKTSTCIRQVSKNYLHFEAFVPKNEPCLENEISDLIDFLKRSNKVFVLTGAGISTESNIPDYRSEGVGLYARSSNRPVQYQQFLSNEEIRRRYWCRNYVGWPRFSSVRPNGAHHFLSLWEKAPYKSRIAALGCLVTQNVDRLHHKAGSEAVVELHGTAFQVICLDCNLTVDRHELQGSIKSENQQLENAMPSSEMIRPDGDVDIPVEFINTFKSPKCRECGGILKPDIVFFGDNVPRWRVDRVYEELSSCDALLVVGSSLQVYSGYRFALQAKDQGKPIAIVNIGPTRADHLAQLKLSRKCGDVFNKLQKQLLLR